MYEFLAVFVDLPVSLFLHLTPVSLANWFPPLERKKPPRASFFSTPWGSTSGSHFLSACSVSAEGKRFDWPEREAGLHCWNYILKLNEAASALQEIEQTGEKSRIWRTLEYQRGTKSIKKKYFKKYKSVAKPRSCRTLGSQRETGLVVVASCLPWVICSLLHCTKIGCGGFFLALSAKSVNATLGLMAVVCLESLLYTGAGGGLLPS